MSLKLAQRAQALLLKSHGIEEESNLEDFQLSYKRGKYASTSRQLEGRRQQKEQQLEKLKALKKASTGECKDLNALRREKRDRNIELLRKRTNRSKVSSKDLMK
jgi:hypothetical protein